MSSEDSKKKKSLPSSSSTNSLSVSSSTSTSNTTSSTNNVDNKSQKPSSASASSKSLPTKPSNLKRVSNRSKFQNEDHVRRRLEIKNDPQMRSVLEKLYDLYKKDAYGYLRRESYCEVHCKIIESLIATGTTSSRVQQIVEADWEKDSKGSDLMTKEMWYDALFELVDLWTNTVDLREYIQFVNTIILKVKFYHSLIKMNDPRAYDILMDEEEDLGEEEEDD